MADSSQNDPSDPLSSRNPFRNALKNFRQFLIPQRPVVSPEEQQSSGKRQEQRLPSIREQPSPSHEQPGEIKQEELRDEESVGSSSSGEDVFGYIRSKGRKFSRRFSSVFEGFADWSVVRPSEPTEPANPAEAAKLADPLRPAELTKNRPATWRGRFGVYVGGWLDNLRNVYFGSKRETSGEGTTPLLTPEHEAGPSSILKSDLKETEEVKKMKEKVKDKAKRGTKSDSDLRKKQKPKLSLVGLPSPDGPTEIIDMDLDD